jgi:hypothetical protein
MALINVGCGLWQGQTRQTGEARNHQALDRMAIMKTGSDSRGEVQRYGLNRVGCRRPEGKRGPAKSEWVSRQCGMKSDTGGSVKCRS